MLDVRKLLAQRPLLFDGGMGTYYKAKPGQECEQANLTDPDGILAVHRAYLAAGADAIKTNTFSLPRLAAAQQPSWEQLADAGWQLAAKAAGETGAAVFADLGPAPDTENLPAEQVYLAVAKRFALLGARNFLFETLSTEEGVLEAIHALKQTVPEAFVLVSFAVLPDGYTREGRYCAELVRRMAQSGVVDAVGLNCVSAPGAMRALVQQLGDAGLPLSVMPNAGYPVVARAQVRYQGPSESLAQCSRIDVYASVSLVQFADAVARSANHTCRVRFVHHYECIIFLGQVTDLIHRCYISVHREYTVGNNDTETLCLSFLQASFQILHIRVGIAIAFRFAKTYAVDDRSMVQRVRDDGVFFAEKRFEHTSVGVETGCIQNGVFCLEIIRDSSFQFLMYILRSADEADR